MASASLNWSSASLLRARWSSRNCPVPRRAETDFGAVFHRFLERRLRFVRITLASLQGPRVAYDEARWDRLEWLPRSRQRVFETVEPGEHRWPEGRARPRSWVSASALSARVRGVVELAGKEEESRPA